MKVSLEKVKDQCRRQGSTLHAALADAGVSRNAFYSLSRKESVVPRSLQALASVLEVPVSTLCEEVVGAEDGIQQLMAETNAIVEQRPAVDPDNVRHTLLLLREKPVDRLRRALRRGRQFNLR